MDALIFDVMVDCCFVDKVHVPDKLGSYTTQWTDGAPFKAAIIEDSSIEAVVAEKQGLTEIYTVVTNKDLKLDYHDVIKRLSDGDIFRITSNNKDQKAPAASTIPIAKVRAERWELP